MRFEYHLTEPGTSCGRSCSASRSGAKRWAAEHDGRVRAQLRRGSRDRAHVHGLRRRGDRLRPPHPEARRQLDVCDLVLHGLGTLTLVHRLSLVALIAAQPSSGPARRLRARPPRARQPVSPRTCRRRSSRRRSPPSARASRRPRSRATTRRSSASPTKRTASRSASGTRSLRPRTGSSRKLAAAGHWQGS